jgi:two-component system chemotaxis sensor kinase CheA
LTGRFAKMNELAKEDLEQLYPVFRDQTLDLLDQMSDDLIAIEAGIFDDETVARLRRCAHTIKGDAACIGLERMSNVAHGAEDYLDGLGGDASKLDKHVVGKLMGLVDLIRGAVSNDWPTDLPLETADVEAREDVESYPGGNSFDRENAAEFKSGGKRRKNVIRVDASKVDDLLNLAGEMMIARSGLEQARLDIDRYSPDDLALRRMGEQIDRLGGLITQFQKSALKMRMVPVDLLFRRYGRAMRELAGEMGKRVELRYSGEKTELDRNLVEMLYEPVLHLLRNAIDHGIEPVVERVRAGKNPAGLIQLRAFHEGEEVLLEVGDDGRGIDLAALKLRARETGLLGESDGHDLSDEESAKLVFADGVSTAEAITVLSGRGIGGAAVKSMVDQVRGTVSLKTERGKGTTFTLKVPLTLAILRSLLFSAGDRLFALPMAAVREVAKTDERAVVIINGVECYRIQGRLLPLLRVSDKNVFDHLIVVNAGGREYAIATGEVRGVVELVVKPLEGRWTQGSRYVGAAVSGDGQVVLIYDARALYERALKREYSQGNYGDEHGR